MTEGRITEAGAAQFPMVRHAEEVGWTPLPPEAALELRGGHESMLFRRVLEETLRRFNTWMDGDAARAVVERIEALPATIDGNREVLAWLRGERQAYDDAERRHRPVRLIDFETPDENALHVTWEWRLKPPTRKGNRADVMFVVNGVPAAIVEHKNPTAAGAIERGVAQLRRYETQTPELLAAPQLFNVTHVLDYWYGVTWNASRRYLARWKERPGEGYRFAVQSFFEPTDFLRTLHHPADPVRAGSERAHRARRAARPRVPQRRRRRWRDRRRGTQPSAGPRRAPAHLPDRRRPHPQGGRIRGPALPGAGRAARLQGIPGSREP